MKSTYPFVFGGDYKQRRIERQQATEVVRLRGTPKRPQSPRDVIFQSGSRGGLIVWKLPAMHDNVAGWRIYKDFDTMLYDSVSDKGTRQYKVPLSAGDTPPVTAIWVSAVNALGVESPKVQVLCVSTAETGAPPDPGVPPGFKNEFSGGGNKGLFDVDPPLFR